MATRLSQDERGAVAQRIFAALCAHYPKHYITMIESKTVASTPEQVLSAGTPAVESSDASVGVRSTLGPPEIFERGPAMDTGRPCYPASRQDDFDLPVNSFEEIPSRLRGQRIVRATTGDVCVSRVAWGGTHEE
jgi:hypothetical protein